MYSKKNDNEKNFFAITNQAFLDGFAKYNPNRKEDPYQHEIDMEYEKLAHHHSNSTHGPC